jgi:hypothetical protein
LLPGIEVTKPGQWFDHVGIGMPARPSRKAAPRSIASHPSIL